MGSLKSMCLFMVLLLLSVFSGVFLRLVTDSSCFWRNDLVEVLLFMVF